MSENNNSISNPDNLNVFKHFFDLSPDLLCIAGFDGYFKKINPSVSKLLGYTEEELFSKPISEFIYSDDKNITATLRSELTKNSVLQNFENRYVTKSGEIIWLAWTSMPVYKEQLIYAIAKNITHKKILEEERNIIVTNLSRINNDLKKISYTSSHDLRAPVNNMISIFSLIDTSKISDPETLELLKMLELTSENLKEALNDHLDVLIQEDHLNTELEDLNFDNSLNSVLLSINSLIQNSNASITTDFSKLEKVKFNKTYMESLFLNLITNSIKYAKPGTFPKISISSRIQDGINQLVVSDNGLGFDMDIVKDKIFGLHQKFHNHVDSRGIGLYLVHNHVTSIGGKITVESKVNQGTTFVISFKAK
ncbi:PAS domain-containing sensor histidine kinase [Flavobacterium cellulosilyticum]|uniref:histidine kinase n=1 Tax=Flavobacterium cellulosilyticum TaxID=2541731 RepID=A0A4R5CAX4_9FLAO|nr:PAS domain-containing sensor histidine kinase [Flavobacterium cellulosilyticum]TDD97088.1 PAS domain-containing sensor histidine kinase [Flavobacterium cellulosilyticum]